MSSELTFEASSHTYTLEGRRLPSVTQVLEAALHEMAEIPEHLVKAAGEFGQHVHAACDLLDRNELDHEALDARLVPYVGAYSQFLLESRALVLASELRVHHPKLGYAGTLDRKVLFPDRAGHYKRLPSVLDLKSASVVPRSVGPQTAAYREADRASGNQVDDIRYCLHLRADGTYRLHRLEGPTDFVIFQSCLNVWSFKNVH